MINKNFNSKKFFILLIIVCALFCILVINAFLYLPKNNIDNEVSSNRADYINRQVPSNTVKTNDETLNEQNSNETVKKVKISLPKITDDTELDEIKAPDGINISKEETESTDSAKTEKELTPEEKAYNILETANAYRADRQYLKALDEYQKAASITSNKEIIASSYDGITSLYAINKRYGTALSFGIKAYNLSPTSEREMVLARLYYKTGDIQKATQRVNNILRREFSDDRW